MVKIINKRTELQAELNAWADMHDDDIERIKAYPEDSERKKELEEVHEHVYHGRAWWFHSPKDGWHVMLENKTPTLGDNYELIGITEAMDIVEIKK